MVDRYIKGPTLVYVNPLLTLEQAKTSMKPISDFILSQNGTVTIETVPSWNAFFKGFVLNAEVVSDLVNIFCGLALIVV